MKKVIVTMVLSGLTLSIYVFSLNQFLFTKSLMLATWGIVYMSLSIISILIWLGIFIYSDSKNKLPWLFIIAILPIIGVLLYLMFGNNFRESLRYKKRLKELGEGYVVPMSSYNQESIRTDMSQLAKNLGDLNQMTCHNEVSFKSKTHILSNGDQKFPILLNAIKQAEHFIFMEYYIFNSDQIGTEVINALMERASIGVEVYLLYDALGSSKKLKSTVIAEMKAAGIRVAAFDPVKIPILSSKVNHRNHRKIFVVDGKTAITGGINIGDEYLHRSHKYGFWRDTSILVEGEIVRDFSLLFAGDWFFATGEKLKKGKYYMSIPVHEDGGVQVIDSGPQSAIANIKESLFRMIMGAQDSIYIITPYLIPDMDIISALRNAALSGIDVRIIVPGKADRKIVYWATQSYFETLLKVGVRIYVYDHVFCHAKVIVVDENIASVGTTNMDIRSFYLNFEVNVMLYQAKAIEALLNDFNIDFSRGTEIIYEQWRQRPLKHRFVQSLAQLFSPIM